MLHYRFKINEFYVYEDIEVFFVETNLKGNKWVICCSYNPNRTFVSNHLDHIAKGINTYSKKYENILLMGNFNVGFTEANMVAFCNEYKLETQNKEPSSFKKYMSPSCIDLFLTNCRKSFESTLTIETGLSDFHKLMVTALKVKHEKIHLKIIQYRDYESCDSTWFFETKNDFFVTKNVNKAIMLRTKLRNQFSKKRTLEARTKYNKTRNISVRLVKKAKRNYYENLDLDL